jgi:hypothetical protein
MLNNLFKVSCPSCDNERARSQQKKHNQFSLSPLLTYLLSAAAAAAATYLFP